MICTHTRSHEQIRATKKKRKEMLVNSLRAGGPSDFKYSQTKETGCVVMPSGCASVKEEACGQRQRGVWTLHSMSHQKWLHVRRATRLTVSTPSDPEASPWRRPAPRGAGWRRRASTAKREGLVLAGGEMLRTFPGSSRPAAVTANQLETRGRQTNHTNGDMSAERAAGRSGVALRRRAPQSDPAEGAGS